MWIMRWDAYYECMFIAIYWQCVRRAQMCGHIHHLLLYLYLILLSYCLECFLSPKYVRRVLWVLILSIAVHPLGWVGWTAQFRSCWRKNHIPGVWRQSRWTLESKEESLGDIASRSAHEWEARGMLQRHSIDHISWHLHGSIDRQWDHTVGKHQISVFREMDREMQF